MRSQSKQKELKKLVNKTHSLGVLGASQPIRKNQSNKKIKSYFNKHGQEGEKKGCLKTKNLSYESVNTIKKKSLIRQSHCLKTLFSENSKGCRFSEQPNPQSTNLHLNNNQQSSHQASQVYNPLTFRNMKGSIVADKQQQRLSVQKCLNHFNKKAKYYLLIVDAEKDGYENKLFYCQQCAINIKDQGFMIYPLQDQIKEEPFLEELNQYLRLVKSGIKQVQKNQFLCQISSKVNEVEKKYEVIYEILQQLKRKELIAIEKYKFDVFQELTRKEKELEGKMKKLQLLNESYIKNCVCSEEKKKKGEVQLYWNLLSKQKNALNSYLRRSFEALRMDETNFRNEKQICEQLLSIFKERLYQLSFDDDIEVISEKEETLKEKQEDPEETMGLGSRNDDSMVVIE